MKVFKIIILITLFSLFCYGKSSDKLIHLWVESDANYRVASDIKKITEGKMNLSIHKGKCSKVIDKVLKDKDAQFAIIPHDALIYKRDIEKQKEFSNKIKMLIPLYDKKIHIIARRDRGIDKVEDLNAKKVNIDKNGNSIFFTGKIIQKTHNIEWEEFYFDPKKAIEKLLLGELDAVVLVDLNSTKHLANIAKAKKEVIKLIPLSMEKNYHSSYIEPSIYPWLDRRVKTSVVTTILATYNYKKNKKVKRFGYYSKNIDNLIDIITKNIDNLRRNGDSYWREAKPYYYTRVKWDLYSVAKNVLLKNMRKSKSFVNSIGMKFVTIDGGKFKRGSSNKEFPSDEKPQKEVDIETFYMATTEVTQKQWSTIMNSNPSYFNSKRLSYNSQHNPVENVSFKDAKSFVDTLNQFENEGNYILPTESEWEYAARDNNKTNLDNYAWYRLNSDQKTHQVALKKPNKLGLYDMYGNVWEWCDSFYTKNYKSDTKKDDFVVLRGGSWVNLATNTRASNRMKNRDSIKKANNGFRVVYHNFFSSKCKDVNYVVKADETLSSIANRVYGDSNRWDIIFYNNKKSVVSSTSKLKKGQVLKIPCIKIKKRKINQRVSKLLEKTEDKKVDNKSIKLLAGDGFSPFLDRSLPHNGMAIQITKEALKAVDENNYSISWENDFSLHFPYLKEGKYDIGIAWYKPNCSRKNISKKILARCRFLFSKKIFESLSTLYKRRDIKFTPKSLKDLRSKVFCRPKGWYVFDLEEKGLYRGKNIILVQPKTTKECFELLMEKKVHFVALDKFTGTTVIKDMKIGSFVKSIETISSPLSLHLIIHKNHPKARELIDKVDRGLEKIKKSGKLQKIQINHLSNFFNK